MTTQLFENNATTTLSSSLASGTTSMSVGSSAAFPSPTGGDNFLCTLIRASDAAIEIISVTAVAGTTWTIVRAQEGTTALDFAAGDKVELRVTAGFLQGLQFGRLLNVQVITTTQVYTETPGTKNCYVRAVAGGGGGGGAAITGAGQASAGMGGGSGAYLEGYYPVASLSGKTLNIGTAGAGGGAGLAGGGGGATNMSGVFFCLGGFGGDSGVVVTGTAVAAQGDTAANPTGGNVLSVRSAVSSLGIAVPTGQVARALGGISPFGRWGSGGSGGSVGQNSASGQSGYDGEVGYAIIYEYA